MATRTVRLTDEDEALLNGIVRATGMTASAAIKRGLRALQADLANAAARPWDAYENLDLGDGGYASAPSTKTREGARDAICARLGR